MNTFKKSMLTFVILTLSSAAFARSLAPHAIEVACELSYSLTDKDGASIISERGQQVKVVPNSTSTYTAHGFTFEGSLRQVCAAGFGGPCSDVYRLATSITKGEITSLSINQAVPELDRNKRFSSSLVIKNERVFLNCDVK